MIFKPCSYKPPKIFSDLFCQSNVRETISIPLRRPDMTKIQKGNAYTAHLHDSSMPFNLEGSTVFVKNTMVFVF